MDNALKSRLGGLVTSLTTIGGYFAQPGDVIPPSQKNRVNGNVLGDSAEHARWIDKEKFINMKKMKVNVPEGLCTPFNTYIDDLESVWAMIAKIDTDLLSPVSSKLAELASSPKSLAIPSAFRPTDIKSAMLSIDPEDFIKKLARNFNGGNGAQTDFGKVYRSASDVDLIATRVITLNEQIDTTSRRNIKRMIDTITASSAEIAEVTDIHPSVSKSLNDVLYRSARWVELMGVFMLQTGSLHESVVSTSEKIKALSQKK